MDIKIYTARYNMGDITSQREVEKDIYRLFRYENGDIAGEMISSDIHIKSIENGPDMIEIVIMYEEY